MDKKFIMGIILICILVILFFYPKVSQISGGNFAMIEDFTIQEKNCNCIGIEKLKPGLSKSDRQTRLCFGLPINCEYTCKKVIDGAWQEITCD